MFFVRARKILNFISFLEILKTCSLASLQVHSRRTKSWVIFHEHNFICRPFLGRNYFGAKLDRNGEQNYAGKVRLSPDSPGSHSQTCRCWILIREKSFPHQVMPQVQAAVVADLFGIHFGIDWNYFGSLDRVSSDLSYRYSCHYCCYCCCEKLAVDFFGDIRLSDPSEESCCCQMDSVQWAKTNSSLGLAKRSFNDFKQRIIFFLFPISSFTFFTVLG